MFWLGLFIALLAGLIGIDLFRKSIKSRFPRIRDRHLDWILTAFLLFGLSLSALDYKEQTAAINHLEDEQKGRVLLETHRAALTKDLRRLPKLDVFLMGIQGDREAVRFANVLKEVFLSVGWTIDGVWEDSLMGGAGSGIVVRQSAPLTNSFGQQVVDSLNKFNLNARLVQKQDIAPGRYEVIVGSRP